MGKTAKPKKPSVKQPSKIYIGKPKPNELKNTPKKEKVKNTANDSPNKPKDYTATGGLDKKITSKQMAAERQKLRNAANSAIKKAKKMKDPEQAGQQKALLAYAAAAKSIAKQSVLHSKTAYMGAQTQVRELYDKLQNINRGGSIIRSHYTKKALADEANRQSRLNDVFKVTMNAVSGASDPGRAQSKIFWAATQKYWRGIKDPNARLEAIVAGTGATDIFDAQEIIMNKYGIHDDASLIREGKWDQLKIHGWTDDEINQLRRIDNGNDFYEVMMDHYGL